LRLQAGVVMPFLLFWFSFCASPDYFLRVCKSAHIRFFIRNLTCGWPDLSAVAMRAISGSDKKVFINSRFS
ncbi:MAG: hypothetical protein KBB13_07940, partial [Anaerolineaceae bacterium]|nr:hypothetical protein [Anaerolineaceae bacterium]